MKNIINPVSRRQNVTPAEYEMWKTNGANLLLRKNIYLKNPIHYMHIVDLAMSLKLLTTVYQ